MPSRIPYGYCMKNGIVEPDEEKSKIVQAVFTGYCAGIPQYKLLEQLTEQGTEGMNPQKIGDMLKNRKYIGDALFPPLITEEQFEQAQQIRLETNWRRGRPKEFLDMKEQQVFYQKIYCGLCGAEFRYYRRKIGKKRKGMFWDCKEHIAEGRISCRNVRLTDEEIQQAFLRVINRLQRESEQLTEPIKQKDVKETARLKGLNHEISKLEKGIENCNVEDWLKLILKRASLQYEQVEQNHDDHYTEQLQKILRDMKIQTAFDAELFLKTVRKITVYPDRLIFTFINHTEWDEPLYIS